MTRRVSDQDKLTISFGAYLKARCAAAAARDGRTLTAWLRIVAENAARQSERFYEESHAYLTRGSKK
jgi:hypothetical protein